MSWTEASARGALLACFTAAVASADPRQMLAAALPAPPTGRCVVVGAGKSAGAMAAALEAAWPDTKLSGLVVTLYGHTLPTNRIHVLEAAHPVPDENSMRAGELMLQAVAGLTPDDLVIALMSGGASALLALPAPGLTLADKQAVGRALLRSGAAIDEMNAVRKHLSAIKGGRLARAAAPAQVITLAISDVPGDDPATIGSGPTVPDPTDFAEARAIVARYGIDLPEAVRRHLAASADETPKPGSLNSEVRLIATPWRALQAAAGAARDAGLVPLLLGDALQGEARDMARTLAGIALSVRQHGQPVAPPCLLLSGGEATVTMTGNGGRGGRNTEFLLAFALALRAAGLQPDSPGPRIWALAADTDGIDGLSDAAGALVGPDSLARMRQAGCDPLALLDGHDSYAAFDAIGDLLRSGPTLTNVNDLRAILIA